MLLMQGEQLKYQLTPLESLGALAKSPTAKVSNLVSINRFDDPWKERVLRGIRAPGTGFPFQIMLGTMRFWSRRDFVVVYKRRPVWVLAFKGEKYERWVIPVEQNQSVISELQKQIDRGGGS